jgi:hypothetical protein
MPDSLGLKKHPRCSKLFHEPPPLPGNVGTRNRDLPKKSDTAHFPLRYQLPHQNQMMIAQLTNQLQPSLPLHYPIPNTNGNLASIPWYFLQRMLSSDRVEMQ